MRKATEDIQFLKDLQKQMQWESKHDYDSQASPRFWSIMDYKWVITAEGYEDRISLYDSDACETESLEDYVEEILKGERREDFSEDAIEELEYLNEHSSLSEVYGWIEEFDDSNRYYPIYEEEVSFIAPNTMFLTKEEAKAHLASNHYHYSEKAHTYAMTAWRAPKVARLIKILNEFDFDALEVNDDAETGQ